MTKLVELLVLGSIQEKKNVEREKNMKEMLR